MEILDIVFKNLHDQYNKLKSLQKNDKICTETEPAWSANEAKILLDTMISNINNLMADIGKDHEVYYRLLGMKGILMYEEAKFLVNIENELLGQELMSKSLDLLNDNFAKSEITFLILRIISHYSFLLLKQGEFDKPQKLLENADEMFTEFKSKKIQQFFYTADEIFLPSKTITPKEETSEKVDRLMTNNLLMLGFVHRKKGNHEKYAFYNHQVLNRQLLNRDFEPRTWVMKAVKLASYFINKRRFREARHHLAAACHILEETEIQLKNSEPNEANIQKWEELQLRFADIAKCWVKYGLFLFGVSKSRLVSLFYGESSQFLENVCLPPNVFSKGNTPMQEGTQDSAFKTIGKSNIETQENCNCHISERVSDNIPHADQEKIKFEDETIQISESGLKRPTNAQNNEYNNPENKENMKEENETNNINEESGENNEIGREYSLNLGTTKEIDENKNECIQNFECENKNKNTEPGENNTSSKNNETTHITNIKTENDLNEERLDDEDKILKNEEEIISSCELKQHALQNDTFNILFTGLEPKDSESFDENQDNSESASKEESSKDTQQHKTAAEDKNLLLFPSLDLSSRENQVTVDFIESAEQARGLFLYTHSWLKQSKMYFTLKDNPMEYVNAILDLTELYKYLAFYEEDVESQYSVQKRRADALETLFTVLREVCPQCYMAVSIELLRELAEVQLEMMGLNLQRLYTAQETHMHTPTADFTLHKMEAMADIHSRLEEFGDRLGHREEVGDGLSEISPSEISGDSLPHYF